MASQTKSEFLPGNIEGAGAEIAYALGKSYWGKGLLTEALTACLDWVFTRPKFSSVYAETDMDNTASRRVMEKVGMRHEKNGDLYDSVAKGGGLLSVVFFLTFPVVCLTVVIPPA